MRLLKYITKDIVTDIHSSRPIFIVCESNRSPHITYHDGVATIIRLYNMSLKSPTGGVMLT